MAPKSLRLAERRSRQISRGTIASITVPPTTAAPSFSAMVSAPSAAGTVRRVQLIWLGQRRVAGISAGTELKFEGMVSSVDGMDTIYNPRYEIVCRQESNDE